jgi:hypothetical protein
MLHSENSILSHWHDPKIKPVSFSSEIWSLEVRIAGITGELEAFSWVNS